MNSGCLVLFGVFCLSGLFFSFNEFGGGGVFVVYFFVQVVSCLFVMSYFGS